MKTEDLFAQYETATGQQPDGLESFLQGMTEAGATLEAAQITQETDPAGYRMTLVTKLGLAVMRVRYAQVPDGRITWTADAVLHDWGSVSGVELTYAAQSGEDSAWTLTVRHPGPVLTIKDRDSGETWALAAAILLHLSPR